LRRSEPVFDHQEDAWFVEDLLAELRRSSFSWRSVRAVLPVFYARARDEVCGNPDLARSILGWGLAFFAAQFVFCALLSLRLDHQLAVRCLVAGSVWLVLSCGWVLAHAGMVKDPAGSRIERLTVPILLTLSRSLLIPPIVLSAIGGHLVLAAFLFAVGGITDVLDGVSARTLGQETRMGAIMDHLVDVIFTAATFLSLVWAGVLSPWIGVLVVVRYFLMIFGGAFIYLFKGPVRIKPTTFGKFSGVILCLMILLQIGVTVYGTPEQAVRISELLFVGFLALLSMTILQVLFIGWYNLNRAAKSTGLPKVIRGISWR
jgi:cardiolipin synthase